MNSPCLYRHPLQRQIRRLSLLLPPMLPLRLLLPLPHQQPRILRLRHRRLLLGYLKTSTPLQSLAQARFQAREPQRLFRV